uniref:Protein FAM47A n=1 Tax=Aotus nancymaae TaxID=37293 RepID=A0A2K5EH03_AOTNA
MGDQKPQDRPRSPGMDSPPWYRDTSPSKRFGEHKHRRLKLPPIDTQNWIFVKKGMDDFHYGCPSPEDTLVCHLDEFSLPKISSRSAYADPQSRRKKPLKQEALFSKLSPAQLAWKVSVAEVEGQLMAKHPLAMHPSLGEDTPPDLPRQVLKPQDPERKLEGAWAGYEGWEKATEEPTEPGKYPCGEFSPWPSETRTPVSHIHPEPPKTFGTSHLCPEPLETRLSHLRLEPPEIEIPCLCREPPETLLSQTALSQSAWSLLRLNTLSLPGASRDSLISSPLEPLRLKYPVSAGSLPRLAYLMSAWSLLRLKYPVSAGSLPRLSYLKSAWSLLRLKYPVSAGSLPRLSYLKSAWSLLRLKIPCLCREPPETLLSQVRLEPPEIEIPCLCREPPETLLSQVRLEPPEIEIPCLCREPPETLLSQVRLEPPEIEIPCLCREPLPSTARISLATTRQVSSLFLEPPNIGVSHLCPEPPKAPKSHQFSELPKIQASYLKEQLQEDTPSTTEGVSDSLQPEYTPRKFSEFFKWARDIGIDEERIRHLYDCIHGDTATYEDQQIKMIKERATELQYNIEPDEMDEVKLFSQEKDWDKKTETTPNFSQHGGPWYLKPKLCEKLTSDKTSIDPKPLLKKPDEPDILDNLYGPIAFKDFILSKGYEMPGIIERLFTRKGWTYDSVKTPMQSAIEVYKYKEDDADALEED